MKKMILSISKRNYYFFIHTIRSKIKHKIKIKIINLINRLKLRNIKRHKWQSDF